MFNDLKLCLRSLSRTPGFTAASALVLALGIGLNAVTFSLCYAMAVAGRPFRDAKELVQLYSRDVHVPDSYRGFSHAAYREMASRPDLFAGVLAYEPCLVGLREGADARRTFSALVSASYFDVLGVPLARGRTFTAEEDRPGSDLPVVVISHAVWRRSGLDTAMLGRELRVNERLFTVVGIAREGFTGATTPFGPELFFPLGVFDSLSNDFEGQATRVLQREDAFRLFLVARLRKGVSLESASSALPPIAAALERALPAEYKGQALSLGALPRLATRTSPADERALGTASLVFLGMTGTVLAVICLNLASMLLARGQGRRREFAVRLALGGTRWRIVRQLLTEGLVLSCLGGTLGVLGGTFGTAALLSSLASRLPVSIALDAATAPAMLAATAVCSVLATCLFALGPALRHSRSDVVSDLKLQAGQDPGARKRHLLPRHPLVALQVALSLSLLIAAGLFLRMARQASQADLGLHADQTVIAEVDAALAGYDEARGLDAYSRIEERLRALPGVRAASVGVTVPFGTVSLGRSVRRAGAGPAAEGLLREGRGGESFSARWNAVGSSYFEAMGVPLKSGRVFSDLETRQRGAPLVAVIDEVLARQLWPEGDALGRSIELPSNGSGAPASGPAEVVGIVALVRDDFFDKTPGGAVYVPLAQGYRSNVHFQVLPEGPGAVAAGLGDAVRREVRAEAPGIPIFSVMTFGQLLSSSVEYGALRLLAGIFSAVGLLATLVALVGIYGAKSYAVSRRTREIGVRVALGATPRRVLGMILAEGLRLGVTGSALGLALGLAAGRVLQGVFLEVPAYDPLTFAVAPSLVLVACAAASWVPARRATSVNPAVALRGE